MDEHEEALQKYSELYQLALRVLDEEERRFVRIDEKASRYLASLTILIGAFAILGRWVLANLLPPRNELESAVVILGILLLLVTLGAWLAIFRTFRRHQLAKPPLDNALIRFFDDNRLLDIYYALARGCSNALIENRRTTDEKSRFFYHAYILIITAIVIFFVFIVLLGVAEWNG